MDYLVTGANRGIGLELVRHLLARGDRVFATCRRPDAATDLHDLEAQYPDGQLVIVTLDVTAPASIDACVAAVAKQTAGVDILINNAGVGGTGEELGSITQEALISRYLVNAAGPLLMAQAFLPLVKAGEGKIIVNLSSGAGSITYRNSAGLYAYAASKAALNMHNKNLSLAVAEEGITSIVMDPGWVKTDMGGPDAQIMPETSVTGMLKVIDDLTLEDSGTFFNYQGGTVPW